MEANVKYLTLALDVRKITDALIDFVEEGKELGDDEDFLRSFLNTLEERGEASVKALREMGQFGSYESLKTIQDVFGAEKRRDLLNKLRAVRDQSNGDRQKSALEAIGLLDSLERTALFRFEHAGTEGRLAFAE